MASSSKALASSSNAKEPSSSAENLPNPHKIVPPKRFMFYFKGDWINFSEVVTAWLIKALKSGRGVAECIMDGNTFIADFVHMVIIQEKTQVMRSIAWIDESEKCFFPTFFYDGETFSDIFKAGICKTRCLDAEGSEKILHLNLKLKEIDEKNTPIVRSHQKFGFESLRENLVKLERGSIRYNSTMNTFIKGMGIVMSPNSIVAIHQYIPTDPLAEAFSSIFLKETRITHVIRGNPDIRRAWLGMSREGIIDVVLRRFHARQNVPKGMTHGIGIHCSPKKCAYLSVNECELDENGLQHMLLCRIIMGNIEQIQPGTDQFCPSSDSFDTGVDDLSNPKVYVIWSSRLICNLLPDCIVSFRLSPFVREFYATLKSEVARCSTRPKKP